MKINVHAGKSKKGELVYCLADAMVNKIVESKDAFLLIVDQRNMDRLLTDESRERFNANGFTIQYPPEFEAARTVMLKNVDSVFAALPEDEICNYIKGVYQIKKIIKIPNSSHLLKVIFVSSEMADRAVKDGLTVYFQKFEKRNIEKEVFIPVVPCYRCYSYGHLTKTCPKPSEYSVCFNCASRGHTYTECNSSTLQCVNCGGDHRMLAAKCPKGKEIIRKKIKERRERSISAGRGEVPQPTPAQVIQTTKLPENYLAVMAATITIADKREAEVPGIFQYIVDEMLEANGIPRVIFPKSVISGYSSKTYEEEKESRKRQRSSDEVRVSRPATKSREKGEISYIGLPDGTWQLVTPQETPQTTPIPTPAATPMSSTRSTPLSFTAPTPANTPRVTQMPTPGTSPQRPTGAIPKQQQQAEKQQHPPKPQWEKEPGLLLIARSEATLPQMNHHQIKKEFNREKNS